ncbi:MAG: hypothetical protein J5958_06735 [Clostridia bacterium]|nr:hypothetical protein [Clostridia bacterium]
MNKDTPITVTLRKVEWSHITVALTRIVYDSKASRLVKDEYDNIAKRIRAQVEHQINQLKEKENEGI